VPTSPADYFDWEDVVDVLEDFNHLVYDKVVELANTPNDQLVARTRANSGLFEAVASGDMEAAQGPIEYDGNRANEDFPDPTRPGSLLNRWVKYNFARSKLTEFYAARRPIREAAFDILDFLRGDADIALPLKKVLEGLQTALEAYASLASGVLKEAAPERFTYKGFTIRNPERFTRQTMGYLLEGVAMIDRLFKARHLDALLRRGLEGFVFTFASPADAGDAHGYYHANEREIEVIVDRVMDDSPQNTARLLDDWLIEVFLHEFGHHVHMSYLDPNARHFWDSGWEEALRARELEKLQLRVTPKDRRRFFEMLRQYDFEPGKVSRKLRGLERLKLLAWLNSPSIFADHQRLIVTPERIRLTKRGKEIFAFFRSPEAWAAQQYPRESEAERQVEIDRTRPILLRILGLEGPEANRDYPWVSQKLMDAARKGDTEVDRALDKLGLPSEYARKNELEDFAETFVLALINPSRLSDVARFRMDRTLALSGLYGKPVMSNLAEFEQATVVARELIARGREREAHRLLVAMSELTARPRKLDNLTTDDSQRSRQATSEEIRDRLLESLRLHPVQREKLDDARELFAHWPDFYALAKGVEAYESNRKKPIFYVKDMHQMLRLLDGQRTWRRELMQRGHLYYVTRRQVKDHDAGRGDLVLVAEVVPKKKYVKMYLAHKRMVGRIVWQALNYFQDEEETSDAAGNIKEWAVLIMGPSDWSAMEDSIAVDIELKGNEEGKPSKWRYQETTMSRLLERLSFDIANQAHGKWIDEGRPGGLPGFKQYMHDTFHLTVTLSDNTWERLPEEERELVRRWTKRLPNNDLRID
jgi:hypothetical protein